MKKQLLFILFGLSFCIQAQTVSTFSFNINGTPPTGLTTALNGAAQRWNNYLKIFVPIKVNLFFVNSTLLPFSAIALANGRANFVNTPFSNYIYPTALANQLAGSELNVGEYDMDIYVNLATNFYFGTGKPTASQSDFMTTIMHELGHGLGFYSSGYVNASNVGSFGNIPPSAVAPITTSFPWHGQDGFPTIYDKYIIKQSQNSLVGLEPNNTTQLGDSIKYRTNYFSGPTYANSSNGGQPVKLSGGTGAFALGVDLLHLHTSVCNSIMSYCWGNGDTVRKPAAWEMGILKEIGWSPGVIGFKESFISHLYEIYPNPAQAYIEFSGSDIHSIDLYDLQGILIKSEANDLNSNSFKMNIESVSKGMYFVCINSNSKKKMMTKKIVINR